MRADGDEDFGCWPPDESPEAQRLFLWLVGVLSLAARSRAAEIRIEPDPTAERLVVRFREVECAWRVVKYEPLSFFASVLALVADLADRGALLPIWSSSPIVPERQCAHVELEPGRRVTLRIRGR